MRKSPALARILALLPLLLFAPPQAIAQPAGEAVLWMAFDETGLATDATIFGFVQFPVYVVIAGVDALSALELSQQLPAGAIVIGQSYPVPGVLNIGLADNPILGLGQCYDPAGDSAWIVRTDLFFATPAPGSDLLFCAGPSTPSSVGGLGPAYVDCNDELFRLGSFDSTGSGGLYPESCAVGNPSIVATEATSWGRVKLGKR